jgi:PhoPQ-activated pathogenicity-related protein
MKTTTEIDDALEHSGQILDLLVPLLATTTDTKLLRYVAVLEAVGTLQDALYDLRDDLRAP